MDSKNYAIGILSTTAVILLVGLVIINTRPLPAVAAGMTTTSGDYVLTVGTATIGNEEVLYVVDAPQQRMIAYRFDGARRQVQVVDGVDLKELRDAAAAATQQGSQQKPKRGRRP